ncbi:MAG: hypothetical protein GX111_10400 [Clostridiales bacterium]|nr:hypothetical protein [Clostridiales bacterium]
MGVANEANQILAKPVIYLYPAKATEVTVTLELEGPLTCSVPEYVNGWTVTAFPDGTLIGSDGQTYPYLFWEADSDIRFDLSEGFCIEGEETPGFLREKLTFLGLNEQETSGFIDYWVPLMKDNAYNLISFQTYAYTDNVKLTVRPEPDSVLRVFMAYSPLGKPVKIKAQELQPFQRTGFTVVEWGGAKSAYAVYH